jgi:DNA-directed RNA polymerase beta subunit
VSCWCSSVTTCTQAHRILTTDLSRVCVSYGVVLQRQRVQYAKDILQKEMLPHVSQEENCEIRKAFFLGYIVHKMLMCSLGRADEDDRDHYGK